MTTTDPTHKALTGKIRNAKSLVGAGKILLLEPDSIAADLLDLNCEIEDVPEILSELLRNVTPDHYAGTRPPQRSYEETIFGSELYAFSKDSERLGCEIYLKFALKEDYFWLVSLHEDRPVSRQK